MSDIKTIKNLADDIGVSKQAVFKRIRKEPLASELEGLLTTVNRVIFVSSEGEAIIKAAFRGEASPRAAGTTEASSAKAPKEDPAMLAKIESLNLQLETRNKHIELLESKVDMKENHIDSLNEQLAVKDSQISKLSDFHMLTSITPADARDKYIEGLLLQLEVKDAQLRDLHIQLKDTTVALLFSQQAAATAQAIFQKNEMQTRLIHVVSDDKTEDEPEKRGWFRRKKR